MSQGARIESLSLKGPAGVLEALLRVPVAVEKAALLCHPHPLCQGSMHSPVIFRAARALHRNGYATLRFNFRGVGRSAGLYDEGRGEMDDVRAALGFLTDRFGKIPLTLLGYSFGSSVGFQAAARDARLNHLIGIGVPLTLDAMDYLADLDKPLWIVQGGRDPFGSLEEAGRLVRAAGERARLIVIPNADHTFTGRLDDLEEALAEALRGID